MPRKPGYGKPEKTWVRGHRGFVMRNAQVRSTARVVLAARGVADTNTREELNQNVGVHEFARFSSI